VVMFGLGNLIYFVAIGVIFLRLFGDPARDEAEAELIVRGHREQPQDASPRGSLRAHD
jgi:hypothetical protein